MATLPSCFTFSDLRHNVTFELRPHYTQMLIKFTGLEDAYLSLREFKELCSMMHFPNVYVDVENEINSFYFKRWS